jgi:protease II
LTNANPKKNFRVMRAHRNNPHRDSWVELMEAKDGEKIEDVDIFKVLVPQE